MGLVAFLSDPKACAERLEELHTVAQDLQSKADAIGMDKQQFESNKQILLSDLKKKTSK